MSCAQEFAGEPRDRGSSTVLVMTAVVALTAAVGSAMVELGATVIDRTRAQSAADAAALASVRGGRDGGAAMASKNGGTLVSWVQIGRDVVVEVRVGAAVAAARATDAP